ncbi:MAG: molybdenum cofactor biosynthesis protein MoaE [Proteobacteria bacterium]|nr:molybdenum cofactor biosynthesis protein MoaE [Pseudomonadota bacterium]
MDLNKMIKQLRGHPESRRIGMIASHLGMVRASSRDGREVTGLEVVYDKTVIHNIIYDIKCLKGIVDVLVDINEGSLKVGDEILGVAVAGDIRENVFAALIRAVDRIKAEASKKKEFFK